MSDRDVPVAFQPGGDNGPGSPGGGPSGHERGDEANVSIPAIDANTTVELLRDARTDIEAVETNDAKAASARDTAIRAIGLSISEYRKSTFATSEAALDYQRKAQNELDQLEKRVTERDTARVERASTTLYRASNVTARLAMREAYEFVQSSEGDLVAPGPLQKAKSELRNASDELYWAVDKSGSEGTVHLQKAWKHADRAVDIAETTVEPEVTVEQGPAFERNGTIKALVYVEITDARPYAYDEATVTVDDTASEAMELRTEPTAGGSATGRYVVDVGRTLENRSVAVSATAAHDPDRTVYESVEVNVTEEQVIPDRPGPNEVTEVEVADESGASVTTRGPGLQTGDVTVRSVAPDTHPDAYASPGIDAQNETAFDNAPDTQHLDAYASPIVDVQNETAFDNATIAIPFNASRLDDENLSIVHFGAGPEGDGWRPLETEIDAANATASANVTSFSRFAVMDPADIWESTVDYADPGWPVLEDFHDLSGWNTAGTVTHQDTLAVLQSESGDDGNDPAPDGPTASISGPSSLAIGESGTWSAAGSSGDGLSYQWSGSVDGTGLTVSEAFGEPANEEITLTVIDDAGRTDTTTKSFQVICPGGGCPEPFVNETAGSTVGLADGSATQSRTTDARTSTMRRTFSLDDGVESAELNARVLANVDPEGLAKITITGEDGESRVLLDRGHADGPVARISGPSTLAQGERGDWSAADSSGDGLSYQWGGAVDGTGLTVSKAFVEPTVDEITLTVTDDEGRSDTTTKSFKATCNGGCHDPFAANSTSATTPDFEAAAPNGDWHYVSADIGEYAGEEVTVTFEAAAGATLAAEYVSVLTDTARSGIPDVAQEMDLHMPSAGEGRHLFSKLNLDPTVADTDADGLRDGDEVDIATDYVDTEAGWKLRGAVTDASSHPFRTDTDGDGLSDYEEAEKWSTDPLLADTSGDGFNDMVDPEPLGRTTTPEATYKTEHWAKVIQNELVVEARPTGAADDIEDIEVEKYVDPWDPVRDAEWQTATQTGTEQDGEYTVTSFKLRDERDFSAVKPDKVNITVTDDDGNKLKIHHNRESGESYVTAGVAAAATTASHTWEGVAIPGGVYGVAGIVILAAGVGVGHALVTAERINGQEDSRELGHPVPPTPAEGTWETTEDIEITLPSGAVYESVGDHDRGFGWEYIKKTGVEQDAIGSIIESAKNGEGTVYKENERVRYIIGDKPSSAKKAILWVLGGSIIAFADIVEDPTGEEVEIDRSDRHPIRDDGNHIRDYDVVEEVVTNPDSIYQNGPNRVYIKYIDGKWYTVRTFVHENGVITVSTTWIYDSKEKLEEFLDRKGYPDTPIYESE